MTTVTAPARPHTPVMVHRVAELAASAPDGVVVDCTVGAGGHARAVLEARAAAGRATPLLVGLDRDPEALPLARRTLEGAPVVLAHARSDQLAEVLDAHGIDAPAVVLFDLGLSSMHVDRPERGFSLRQEGPLDMRMDPTAPGPTAADLVNDSDERTLTDILRRYGEERHARRIARAIIAARPLRTTTELAAVVAGALPPPLRRGRLHPATRTFQALRIAVNAELEVLAASLPLALARLRPGGVCIVLSYHSLEDRIVKRSFADAAAGCTCPPDLPVCACGRVPIVEVLTRRPERPDAAEVAANPRARAARLRAARRLEDRR